MINIWYYPFDCNNDSHFSALSLALSQFDLKLHKIKLTPPHGMGIVLFETFSSQLCDFISQTSNNGNERIIAVCVSAQTLKNCDFCWQLMYFGASDVVWFDSAQSLSKKIAAQFKRWEKVEYLLNTSDIQLKIIGKSYLWKTILRGIVEVAHFTDSPVLIRGESGTGKELIAKLIHTLDPRSDKGNLIILDCTTIVPELSGSEFFGHERGAFTGAVTSRDGAFALADKGTLFLDEVADLPLKLQAQLLRVMQEKTYKRVGGNTWHSTDFRLICASNRDLLQMIKEGQFRSDLYYRIAGWNCVLPPLRERCDDIPLLAGHFIQRIRQDVVPEFSDSVYNYLLSRHYPGNVRDLKQLVGRIMCKYVGFGRITPGDIPDEERPRMHMDEISWHNGYFQAAIKYALMRNYGLKEIRRITENIAISIAIEEEKGNLQKAAQRLGVTARALQMRRAAERQKNDSETESVISTEAGIQGF